MVYCEFAESFNNNNDGFDRRSVESRIYDSYMRNNWIQVAESTLPLTASKLAAANHGTFQASIEMRSKQISNKVIVVNLISLLINLSLAIIAFYFSFANNSSSTTAFAADCVLDFISSAIVLWRYHGDLSSVKMHAREQIACIYMGALFEISALGIIIKALSDMLSSDDPSSSIPPDPSSPEMTAFNELVYLAIAATIACSVLTVFKCNLYKTLRDNSILLDVINTIVSTVFAMSIVMSQVLINVNPSFWYLDPILGIVLAIFMIGFGIKVIHQNFNILKPVYQQPTAHEYEVLHGSLLLAEAKISDERKNNINKQESNLSNNNNNNRHNLNLPRRDYATINFP